MAAKSEFDGPWRILFFVDPVHSATPGMEFLDKCPTPVRAELLATLDAVAGGPPPSFRGGLRWQPMHGDMTGWFEARTKHSGWLYRLFCLLEREAPGLDAPSLIVITGARKKNETAFSTKFYRTVRSLGDRHRATEPRSVA